MCYAGQRVPGSRAQRRDPSCPLAHYCTLHACVQVADKMGDAVEILKVDVDENQELSSNLQVTPWLGAVCMLG